MHTINRNRTWAVVAVILLSLSCVQSSVAQTNPAPGIPRLLSYQGVLTTPEGMAIPDGNYVITLRIYNQAEGGAPLWEETQTVNTLDGVFDAYLGLMQPLNLPFNEPYWLAAEMQGEPEMTPRTRMVAMSYAMHSVWSGEAGGLSTDAYGVVRSINEMQGDLTLLGGGGVSVVRSGDTIRLIGGSGVTLPGGVADGQIIRWNNQSNAWELDSITLVLAPRLSGKGTAAEPLDIAQQGAAEGQVLRWNNAANAWEPDDVSVSVSTRLIGDGSPGSPIDLASQGAEDGEVLVWNSVAKRWEPQGMSVTVTPRLSGDGSPTDPLDIAQQGAVHGQYLRWNDGLKRWEPDNVGPEDMRLQWGAIWNGDQNNKPAELPIGTPGQVLSVKQNAQGIEWSSDLMVNSITATGDVVVGGQINADGDINTSGAVNAVGDINTSGNVNADSNVNVGGDIHSVGNISADGGLLIEGTTVLRGPAVFEKTATFNDSAVFNGSVVFGTLPSIPLSQNALLTGGANGVAEELLTTGQPGAVLRQDANGAAAWIGIGNFLAELNDSVGGDYWRVGGNIGTDPTTDYIGTGDATDVVVGTNGAERVRITTAGAVGVGTTLPAPGVRLDVVGRINSDDSYDLDTDRWLWDGPGGNGVVMVGPTQNTLNTGDSNMFVGSQAGRSNTSGFFNTFAGANAGMSNTTGAINTFFGTNAGQFTTTGFANVFVGTRAGMNTTTGTTNTFMGNSAGVTNTTGSENTFIGQAAGAFNTTGNLNVALGQWAGAVNASHARNVYLGGEAGQFNAGDQNTFVGNQAGYQSTGGSLNTFVGQASGRDNQTGRLNTGVGYFSRFASPNLTNATAIGAQAQVNQDNSLVLGAISGVNGAAASTNVGVGTNAPANRLHVVAPTDPLRLEGLELDNSLMEGLLVDANGVVHRGSLAAIVGAGVWTLTGNSGTNPAANFLGTTDAQSLVFRTNNVERARFDEANGGHFVPGVDDTYDLGSSLLRWRDLYLGPSSLHLVSTTGETGTAQDWKVGIEETSTGGDAIKRGNLQVTNAGTEAINITPGGNVGVGATFGGTYSHPIDATLAVQGDLRVSRRGATGFNGSVHLVDQAFDNGGGSAPYFFQYFLANEADFRMSHGNNGVVFITTGTAVQHGRMQFSLNGGNRPMLMLDTAGILVNAAGVTGAARHAVHAVNSHTIDERAAVFGNVTANTTNQAIGVWGDASQSSGSNTGTIGVLATGNGTPNAGQSNVALQVNDGEFAMGRTTQTGTGYTVVEAATAGTAYRAEGPSGVIEVPAPGAINAGATMVANRITVNNRYVNASSIVLVEVLDQTGAVIGTAPLAYSTSVDNRAAGSFVLTVIAHNTGAALAPGATETIRIGYTVVNPSK